MKRLHCTTAQQLASIREDVWDWLVKQGGSFQPKGTINATFEEMVHHSISSQYELSLFSSPHTIIAMCSKCNILTSVLQEKSGIIILYPDRMANNDMCVQKSLQSYTSISQIQLSDSRCNFCNDYSLHAISVEPHWAPFIFVRLPVLRQPTQSGFIDLEEYGENNSINKITLQNDCEGHVMSGIKVEEHILLDNESYHLTAAVTSHAKHFTTIVRYEDEYYHMDDLASHIPSAPTFSSLFYPGPPPYKSADKDGVFLLLYRKEVTDAANPTASCGAGTPSTISQPPAAIHTLRLKQGSVSHFSKQAEPTFETCHSAKYSSFDTHTNVSARPNSFLSSETTSSDIQTNIPLHSLFHTHSQSPHSHISSLASTDTTATSMPVTAVHDPNLSSTVLTPDMKVTQTDVSAQENVARSASRAQSSDTLKPSAKASKTTFAEKVFTLGTNCGVFSSLAVYDINDTSFFALRKVMASLGKPDLHKMKRAMKTYGMKQNDELVQVGNKWYLSVAFTILLFLRSPGIRSADEMKKTCHQVINFVFCSFANRELPRFGHIKIVAERITLDEFQTLFRQANSARFRKMLKVLLCTREYHWDCQNWRTQNTIQLWHV